MSANTSEDPSAGSKPCYLPKWLLESRAQLEESRLKKLEVDRLLSVLNGQFKHLGSAPRDDACKESSPSPRGTSAGPESASLPPKQLGLCSLPRDVLSMALFRHLDMSEVLRLSSASRGMQALLRDDDCWVVPFEALPLSLRVEAEAGEKQGPGGRRRAVLKHHVAIQAIRSVMWRTPGHKAQADEPRGFDPSQGGGQRAKVTTRPLLEALRHMAQLTSDPGDEASNRAFRRNSTIRWLLPLLKSEGDTVGELVACVVANLLCPLTPRLEHGADQMGVRSELEVLRGRALLVSLLTSPTARLTLAGPGGHNPNSHHHAQAVPSSDGMMALGSQRLSARHAARALVNLFAPSLATCVGYKSGHAEPATAEAKGPGDHTRCAKLAGRWAAHYFFSSGNEQDVHTLHLTSAEEAGGRGTRLEGQGADFLGSFSIDGSVYHCWDETACVFTKTYVDRGGVRPRGGHVSHVAWAQAGPTEDTRHTYDGEGGWWGVWEMVTTSSDAHYELQKGGVFRLMPLAE